MSLSAEEVGITIKTTDGAIYRNCRVFSHNEERLTVLHSKGMVGIHMSVLPVELQEKYGYDPVKAKVLQDNRDKERERRNEAIRNARIQQSRSRNVPNSNKSNHTNPSVNKNRSLVRKRTQKLSAVVEVTQVLKDGFLAKAKLEGDTFGQIRKFVHRYDSWELNEFVKVQSSSAFASKLYEGRRFRVEVYPAGTYTYITVLGSQKTIKRFATTEEQAVRLDP